MISVFHGPCLSPLQLHHLEAKYRLCFRLGFTLLYDLQEVNQTRDQESALQVFQWDSTTTAQIWVCGYLEPLEVFWTQLLSNFFCYVAVSSLKNRFFPL